MGTETMGRVVVHAKIENLEDLYDVKHGRVADDRARSIEIDDALVDTGATMLSLPKRYIEQLGLRRHRTSKATTSGGIVEFGRYDVVRLTIQDRDFAIEVAEVHDDCPALIGQIPLEMLDFVVNPIGQRLIGNPAHNGEHMFELY